MELTKINNGKWQPGQSGNINGRPVIHVLTLEHDIISTLTPFVPPLGSRLFHAFDLPLVIPEAARAKSGSTPRPERRPGLDKGRP
jgi:hypothetical protein